MAKPRQLDLVDYIAKRPQKEMPDAFTGELFTPKARNHYEENSGVPVAPQVDVHRPTIRQRIENLLNRGVDPLAAYVGSEGIDMDVPDDPEAPLTGAEQLYIDAVSESLAEAAPLPDEGLPRPPATPPAAPPAVTGNPAAPGVASPQAPPQNPESTGTVPSR